MSAAAMTYSQRANAEIKRLVSIDVRSLATVRVLLAVILLVDWTWRWTDYEAFYADSGMISLAASRTHLADAGRWSLHWLGDSPLYQQSLFAGALIAAACLLVGWRTRWATFACWVFVVSFWQRNPLVCNYGDTWLRIQLFWAFWLPWGETWSIDAWRRARQGMPVTTSGSVASVASACLLLQLSLLYVFAGLWKWNDSWLGGHAALQSLQIEYARRPIAKFLMQWPGWLRPLTRATLGLELLGPLVIWSPWRTSFWRVAMIGAFVGLHVGIEICFRPLMLSYVSMAPWFLLVPTGAWDSRALVGLTRAWQRFLSRAAQGRPRSQAGDEATVAAVSHGTEAGTATKTSLPATDSAPRRIVRRLADLVCLAALVLVVLWNVATFDPERLGWVVPVAVRPAGQITMLWQTWDMFYVPQTRNSWLVAEARLHDGRRVDLLHGDRPFDRRHPESNFDAMPNPRWRLFFDRLGTWPDSPYHADIARYLLRTANERRTGNDRVVSIDLMLVARTTPPDSDSPGYNLRTVATIASDDAPADDSLKRLFDSLDRDLREP